MLLNDRYEQFIDFFKYQSSSYVNQLGLSLAIDILIVLYEITIMDFFT